MSRLTEATSATSDARSTVVGPCAIVPAPATRVAVTTISADAVLSSTGSSYAWATTVAMSVAWKSPNPAALTETVYGPPGRRPLAT